MSRRKAILDHVIGKIISRKLFAYLIMVGLTCLFALTDFSITDRWSEVFERITIIYIGTQGAVDLIERWKAVKEIQNA